MTAREMEAGFPSEWVLVGKPQTDSFNRVQSGTMLWHSKNRNEVYRKANETNCKLIAVLYTGPIPGPGQAIVLGPYLSIRGKD